MECDDIAVECDSVRRRRCGDNSGVFSDPSSRGVTGELGDKLSALLGNSKGNTIADDPSPVSCNTLRVLRFVRSLRSRVGYGGGGSATGRALGIPESSDSSGVGMGRVEGLGDGIGEPMLLSSAADAFSVTTSIDKNQELAGELATSGLVFLAFKEPGIIASVGYHSDIRLVQRRNLR